MKETEKMVYADFTRLTTQQTYEAIKKYNSMKDITHGTIEVLDWKEKENEVTIKLTENDESEIMTDTREAIHFAVKLALCTAFLINQRRNTPNIAEIKD